MGLDGFELVFCLSALALIALEGFSPNNCEFQ
jgi:hypothetical protein